MKLNQIPHKKSNVVKIPRARVVLPPVAKRFRKPNLQQQTEEALRDAPRITNETVAEHREEVLKGARKYKYPLEHSKQKIVLVSTILLSAAIVTFLVYCILSLYKFQSTSSFTYRITQILPFPVAKAGKHWVSYESYLFELRRYMHYYETQQDVDFTDTKQGMKHGKQQLEMQKPQALDEVIMRAYVKDLAKKNGISVSESEVRTELDMLRLQNHLTRGDEELTAIVRKFYNWSLDDLRSELKDQLLVQKVAAKLDTAATSKAQTVLSQAQGGGDFAALAKQYSDDVATKDNGGQYNDAAITVSSNEVPPQVVMALKSMRPNDISSVIVVGNSLEIVKLLSTENNTYKAAHIQIRLKDIRTFTDPLAKAQPPKRFIRVSATPNPQQFNLPGAPQQKPQ